ncbi:MAG: hypothetical protein APF83_11615 [Lutibacter sp. BRH_c52]|nr:MAG: hypothetical protein APF83_07935 [Lutibacter sp. BRH_c52]KUO69850.1 MAG: hypothetical protein APF83_11615 [Lutibacter sp. BRH_c52]
MNKKIHNLSLRGITGIFVGVISLIFIFGIHLLLSQYSSGSAGVSMLPISFFEILIFGISFLYILISYFTIVLINKRRRKKNYLRKWDFKAKKIRRFYLVLLLLGGIILYFLMVNGLLKLIIPASLILYGIAGIVSNKHTFGATAIFGFVFIILGILVIIFPNLAFYLWGFAFGICHIIYGLVYFNFKK